MDSEDLDKIMPEMRKQLALAVEAAGVVKGNQRLNLVKIEMDGKVVATALFITGDWAVLLERLMAENFKPGKFLPVA